MVLLLSESTGTLQPLLLLVCVESPRKINSLHTQRYYQGSSLIDLLQSVNPKGCLYNAAGREPGKWEQKSNANQKRNALHPLLLSILFPSECFLWLLKRVWAGACLGTRHRGVYTASFLRLMFACFSDPLFHCTMCRVFELVCYGQRAANKQVLVYSTDCSNKGPKGRRKPKEWYTVN